MTAAAPPPVAAELFPRLDLACAYAELLVTVGAEHGVIGPGESDRVWDRHLVNSALVGKLIAAHARVIDVGSGAGLPGLALAIARPDLEVTLVEPLQRRVRFLQHAVEHLGLAVEVRRARVEALPPQIADVVTARAVAPLQRLVPLCLPLLKPAGTLLAVKGAQAEAEIRQWRASGAQIKNLEITVERPRAGREVATVVRVCRTQRGRVG